MHSEDEKYVVRCIDTAHFLGFPTEELIQESFSEISGSGACHAHYVGGRWDYVSPCNARTALYHTRIVYVEKNDGIFVDENRTTYIDRDEVVYTNI